MTRPDEFITYLLDLLAPLGPVAARRMFGGHGIFLDGLMFALIADDRLYFKVDDQNAARFVEAGCAAFSFRRADRVVEMSYREAPDGSFDDPEAFLDWARSAVAASRRAKR